MSLSDPSRPPPGSIPALRPGAGGHRFVFYGDACSGVPGAPHEAAHARVNAVVAALDPPPEFILFPGDEIIGLTPDAEALRAQWRHWWDTEMAWRGDIPIYNSTGNHTAWDPASEAIFAEAMPHHPRNGPPGQEGLSYWVRHGDLLIVVIHTLWSGLGGEGHIELDWLAGVLEAQGDARHILVMGHHPAFPVNGYAGAYQRCIGPEYVPAFWALLRRHGVTGYLCSHILAFDIQCREGVLQICSAGAGTIHRMPEGAEYLHAVQMALDVGKLQLQVLDDTGAVRESACWPPLPMSETLGLFEHGGALPWDDPAAVTLHLKGRVAVGVPGRRQTLAAFTGDGPAPVWVGLVGRDQRLVVQLQPVEGRSPHQWLGPPVKGAFDIDLLIEPAMGPGGILMRSGGEPWTGLDGMSAFGAERVRWPKRIEIGGTGADGFLGRDLDIALSWRT